MSVLIPIERPRVTPREWYTGQLRFGHAIGLIAATAVAALLTCASGCSGSHSAGASTAAGRVTVRSVAPPLAPSGIPENVRPVGVPNFHVVHPFLVRGGAPTPEGLRSLKALGVRTIFDLRISPRRVRAERRLAESMGMRDINLPMSDQPPTPQQVRELLDAVNRSADQPVFVHCQYGADRTGAMVGIYRERYDHWGFQRTYTEMRRYGFKPFLHKLKAAVQQYGPSA